MPRNFRLPELTMEDVFGPTKGDPGEMYLRSVEEAEHDLDSAEYRARELGRNIDSARAFPHINRLAHDPNPQVRRLGIYAMAHTYGFGNRDAAAMVRRLLEDPEVANRVALAEGMVHADVHNHKVCEDVERLAHDPSPKVRAAAAAGMFNCGKQQSDRTLIGLFHDRESIVRDAVSEHLTILEEREDLSISPDEILDCVRDISPTVRARICNWLVRQPMEIALPNLLVLSRDPILMVSETAIATLAYLDHPDAVRRLLDGLKDKLDGIRIEASAGLIRVPGQEVARELFRLAKDPNSRVRRNVAQGVTGRVEPDMVPALAKLATDPADANIRSRAAKALAGLPGPQTDAILAKLLNDPKSMVRNLARRLLTTRGHEAPLAPELATEVRHPEDQVASCKESFLGGGSSGPEAWRKFLGRVASVEGAPSGSTEGVPAVVFTTRKGSHAALLPFGPVQWIGLAVTLPLPGRGRKKPPRLDYALLGAKEAKAWMQSLGVEALLKGEDLAQRLGWL